MAQGDLAVNGARGRFHPLIFRRLGNMAVFTTSIRI